MTALSLAEAAHLLRRAGIGGTREEISDLVQRGREKAVNYLIDYDKISDGGLESQLSASFEFLRARTAANLNDENFNESELRFWWLSRFLLSPRPFEEKMTLFWHNHFATSLDKVPAIHMYTQNLDLRSHALGRFDDLLLAVSRGAAMLIWLDGVTSTKEQPNENFAREIQEVFSMGTHDVVTGEANYTEGDVREIARAFTGWRSREKAGDGSPFAYEFYVDASEYDAGSKTIYGQAANYSGEDVITVIAQRPATARYLVNRLFEFFVYPLDLATATDRATVEKFAAVYFSQDHSIKELMRAIFVSDEFFSERARFALIKNPVEFAVGAIKMLDFNYLPGFQGARNIRIERSLRAMGMDLFRPPDVFGWKLNLGFINSQAMVERTNFLETVLLKNVDYQSPQFLLRNYQRLWSHVSKKSAATVRQVLETLGPIEVGDAIVAELDKYLTTDASGNAINWKKYRNINPLGAFAKLAHLFRLGMSTLEFQLN